MVGNDIEHQPAHKAYTLRESRSASPLRSRVTPSISTARPWLGRVRRARRFRRVRGRSRAGFARHACTCRCPDPDRFQSPSNLCAVVDSATFDVAVCRLVPGTTGSDEERATIHKLCVRLLKNRTDQWFHVKHRAAASSSTGISTGLPSPSRGISRGTSESVDNSCG